MNPNVREGYQPIAGYQEVVSIFRPTSFYTGQTRMQKGWLGSYLAAELVEYQAQTLPEVGGYSQLPPVRCPPRPGTPITWRPVVRWEKVNTEVAQQIARQLQRVQYLLQYPNPPQPPKDE